MDFVELQQHIANNSDRTIFSYPTDMEKRPRWQVERDELMQHYEGIASKVLADAFPNEEEAILNYRKKIYQPLTRGAFLKAVDEIWRMFSSSRYSVSFGNTDFEKWADSPKWDGMSMEQWVLRVAYACRIVDPNGYIILTPKGEGLRNGNERIDLDLGIVNSKTIIEDMPDLLSWGEGRHGILSGQFETIHYLTDEIYAISKGQADAGKNLELVYTHNAGRVPAVKLGGRTIIEIEKGKPKSRQISDFAHALPLMNSLAVVDNQYVSVMLSSCFPHRFIQGVPCKTCNGVGQISSNNDSGEQTVYTCTTCNGGGQVFPVSPLLGYFINPSPPGVTPDERTAMAERKPIEFAGPDISTIQFLADRRDKLKVELNEALDIQRAQMFAQSGVSKEKDREGMYIQIGRIADYWFNVMLKSVLEIAQIYWEPIEAKRGAISVTAPVSFDIKNEGDLLAEFVDLYGNAPAILRYPAFADYIQKRFANNSTLARAMSLAVQYAPLSIANKDEKLTQSAVDLAKATWAAPLLLLIMKETNGFMTADNEQMEDAQILAMLDVKMAPYLAQTAPPVASTLADGILNGQFN
jgi:hypothetical protein